MTTAPAHHPDRVARREVPAHLHDMHATTTTSPAPDPASPASSIVREFLPDEPLIDLRTLSQWLSVSESTVRKWSARGPGTGLLPTMIRVNGQIRFRPSDVREFLIAKELR